MNFQKNQLQRGRPHLLLLYQTDHHHPSSLVGSSGPLKKQNNCGGIDILCLEKITNKTRDAGNVPKDPSPKRHLSE